MEPERRLYRRFTYRQIVEHYGLKLCTDQPTCKRKQSKLKHRYGGSDSMGIIHLQDADTRMVTRKGMRTVLKACAQSVLKLHDEPVWKRLYMEDTWAWKEGDETWKVRFTAEASDKDRATVIRSAKWAGVHLRTDWPHIYRWAHAPRYRK